MQWPYANNRETKKKLQFERIFFYLIYTLYSYYLIVSPVLNGFPE